MRVVVDTNVFVSAALKVGSLPAIALRLVERFHVLLQSAATEQQLLAVLARPYLASLIASTTNQWIAELLIMAERVAITDRIVACRDPTDDKFLELAVTGNADLILSGDKDLLALHPFRSIPVVTPAAFVLGA
jgi:putative PIN family toxin of toxin-antitoxin system